MDFNFSWIDASVILLYIAFIIWWGLRHGKSQDSASYFLAGRNMTWPIIGLSLFAASISSSTLIGQSGDAYSTGIAVFNYNLFSVLVMIFFAWFFLPFYIRSGVYTMPEFLERRFDSRSRYYFSAISIIGNVFLDAAGALYAAALIIKIAIPTADLQVIILIFALITASYTIPGGLSSVINTELIQAIVLITGSIILTILCIDNGGWEYITNLMASNDTMMKLVRPMNDPSVPWLGLFVGIPILGFYFWGNNQTLVQRVLSAKNVDEGREGVLLVGFLTVLTLFFIILPGVMARKFFPNLDKVDMVYPSLVINMLPVGLLGVMLAALLSALTAALSAILNSASTMFTMDFYSKMGKTHDTKRLVYIGKLSSLVILLIAAFWAPQIGKFGSLLKYYQEMLSYIAPPVVAAFFIGLFSKRANGSGIFIGLMGGLAVAVLLLFFKSSIFGNMHFLLIVPFLFGFSILVMYLASLFFPAPERVKVDGYTWHIDQFREETRQLKKVKWYSNYRFWSLMLFIFCMVVLYIYQ